jgi:glycosyltransferase involved in cell wall biosynthesis
MTSTTSARFGNAPGHVVFLLPSAGTDARRSPGGGDIVARDLVNDLQERGWNIIVAAPPESPLLSKGSIPASVVTIPIDLQTTIRNPRRFAAAMLRLARFAATNRRCVYYGHSFRSIKWLVLCRMIAGARTVCHLHEGFFHMYSSVRARCLAKHIDKFIAISTAVRDAFLTGTGVPPGRVALVHNGVSVALWTDRWSAEETAFRIGLGVPPGNALVTMVARTDPFKGHSVFVEAAATVAAVCPDVTFLICGMDTANPETNETIRLIRERIAMHPLAGRFICLPYRADARRIMRVSSIVVVPSLAEGFGLTAIEAMAEGTPVVASRVGGLAEIISDGETGLLASAGDAAGFARAILALLSSPTMPDRLGRAGYRRVAAAFSRHDTIDKVDAILRGLTCAGAT